MPYFETSALDSRNIEEAFQKAAELSFERRNEQPQPMYVKHLCLPTQSSPLQRLTVCRLSLGTEIKIPPSQQQQPSEQPCCSSSNT